VNKEDEPSAEQDQGLEQRGREERDDFEGRPRGGLGRRRGSPDSVLDGGDNEVGLESADSDFRCGLDQVEAGGVGEYAAGDVSLDARGELGGEGSFGRPGALAWPCGELGIKAVGEVAEGAVKFGRLATEPAPEPPRTAAVGLGGVGEDGWHSASLSRDLRRGRQMPAPVTARGGLPARTGRAARIMWDMTEFRA